MLEINWTYSESLPNALMALPGTVQTYSGTLGAGLIPFNIKITGKGIFRNTTAKGLFSRTTGKGVLRKTTNKGVFA